jgi:hypothetical protein
MREFSGNVLEKHGMRENFPEISVLKIIPGSLPS